LMGTKILQKFVFSKGNSRGMKIFANFFDKLFAKSKIVCNFAPTNKTREASRTKTRR